MSTEGRKDDTDKIRMDLLPPEFLFAVAEILTFGAKNMKPITGPKACPGPECSAR